MSDYSKYSKHYSESGFWEKLKEIDGIGHLIELATKLYRIMTDPEVPKWVKAICMAALGYLIFPFDVIFDVIPFFGYVDDAGVLGSAVAAISSQWRKV